MLLRKESVLSILGPACLLLFSIITYLGLAITFAAIQVELSDNLMVDRRRS